MPTEKTSHLKKKYNALAAKNMVVFRMNTEEASLLEKMMKDLGCTNISAFIKYKIFGESTEYAFKKMLRSGDKTDIETVIKNLMEELNGTIGYLNYRFTHELSKLENTSGSKDDKNARIRTAKMREWKEAVLKKTDRIFTDCQEILNAIGIRTERRKTDSIQFVPDEVLEAAKDWNDTTSPESHEIARRALAKLDKQIEEANRRRDEK